MTMHVEHSIAIRRPGATFFGKLMALASAELGAWQIRRAERANLEILRELAPETLDDIGIEIVRIGRPARTMIVCHAHAIAAATLSAAQSTKRGES